MRTWHILRSRLRSLVFRESREAELREELQLHIERETERLQANGLPQEEAHRLATRRFGSVEEVKEACRDARGAAALDAIARDARYALRRLLHEWRFTVAAVLILGLAIGANAAIFSVVNAVLFREPAGADPDRLVNIYQNDRAGRPMIVASLTAYREIAAYTDVFEGTMASTIPTPTRFLHGGAVRNATVEYATASYLDTLQLRPALGRWFEEAEDRPDAPLAAVLGHQAWIRQFFADPSVIGRVIRIEGEPATIVGIGPAGLRGTVDVGVATDLWLPVSARPNRSPLLATQMTGTTFAPFFVKARLRPGVTVAQAEAAMDVLAQRLTREYPELFRTEGEFAVGPGITVVPATEVRIHPQADGPFMAIASLVLFIVGLVLAIACSNLATLLLVRGAARAKEISVRLALGATRRRLLRQLLVESLLLSVAGGAFGCVLAWWGMEILLGMDLPVRVDVALDYRVLAFALAVSLAMGVLFGLAPALKATKIDILTALRDEGLPSLDHRRLTLKNALILVQVVVSVLLLGGASIFLQMLAATRAHRVGYAVDGVAMLETDLHLAGYAEPRATALYDELLRRIQTIPGVESAALLSGLPMGSNGAAIVVDNNVGQQDSAVEASMIDAGPGFFHTLQIPLLYGRVFDARDRADSPRVAVITATMARQRFGVVNAVGRRFRSPNDPDSWTEVIGVVSDTGTGDFGDDVLDPIAPPFYRSYTQSGRLPTTVLARTSGDAAALVMAMQRELRAMDSTLPVVTGVTMAQNLENSRTPPKIVATILGALAALGLVLTSIGLYAVVAFAVARRSREIGIRMALGARRQHVVWSIARGVAGLVGAGTGAGLGLATLVMLAMRGSSGRGDIGIGSVSVYRPDIDPVALLAIAAVIAVVGVLAAFVPARRAASMDPLDALRHD